ncbi:unnamed protein product [Moneuplotes crassus]|uniref:Uncharacterized protein n=1 Tax=Euplotes crassus TaxID=5936 RepID=A0AAD1Y523_EUPCR|nr:unnamed protein product [Moneuplotes crassus]
MNRGWNIAGVTIAGFSLCFGFYGRRLVKFTSVENYKKYHMATLCNLVSGVGISMTRKTKHPIQAGILFIAGLGLASGMGYYEGLLDMWDKEPEFETETYTRIGRYLILAGYGLLILKNGNFIP